MNNQLHTLFTDLLSELYDAENQIVEALPKLIDKTNDEDLSKALSEHLEQTRTHVERLDQIGTDLDIKLDSKDSKILKTILSEGEEAMSDLTDNDVSDAALIGGAQKVEHFEIAGYGTAAAWAKVMGHDDAADLLGETLKEEKAADAKLSKIAEGNLFKEGINEEAADTDEDKEE